MSSSLVRELLKDNGLHELVVGPFKKNRRLRVHKRNGRTKPAVPGIRVKKITNMIGLHSLRSH